MGLYPIQCPACKKEHLWSSGNPSELRCVECQEKGKGIKNLLDAAEKLHGEAIRARAGIRDLSVLDFIFHPVRTHDQVNNALDLEDRYWRKVQEAFNLPQTV